MRKTIGGDVSYETSTQKLNRERQERRNKKNSSSGSNSNSDSSGAEEETVENFSKTCLWIPGEDEDADNDIFKL